MADLPHRLTYYGRKGGISVDGQSDADRRKTLQPAYNRACQSYEAITEFRAKLLALLPLATGTGAFLLLERVQKGGDELRKFLGPIGLFGAVVTLGLFLYELRGIQRCHRIEVQATTLEKQLGLSAEQGLFRGQPPRALGNMLGPPAAGLIIYLATIVTWLGLAVYGFTRNVESAWWWRDRYYGWVALIGYFVVLVVAWVLLSRWLQRSATGRLPKNWERRKVVLPPIELTYECDDNLCAAKQKATNLIDANKNDEVPATEQTLAELDQAEKEYLLRLHQALLLCRVPAAMPSRQEGKHRRIRH